MSKQRIHKLFVQDRAYAKSYKNFLQNLEREKKNILKQGGVFKPKLKKSPAPKTILRKRADSK